MERLTKMFGQTQVKIESLLDSIPGLNSGPYTSEFVPNKASYWVFMNWKLAEILIFTLIMSYLLTFDIF